MLWRGVAVLLVLLALWAAALGLQLSSARQADWLLEVSRGYAQATGGLGLGAAVTLEWSARHLDPRLERASNCDAFPIPGGPGFCPDQSTGLFSPPDEVEGLPRLRAAPR